MKWSSHFTAEYFNILSSDFYLEPSALLDVSGRGYHEGGPGTTTVKGAGAGHATVGGTGKFPITGFTKSEQLKKYLVIFILLHPGHYITGVGTTVAFLNLAALVGKKFIPLVQIDENSN